MNVLRNSWNPQLPAELFKFGGIRVENRHSRDADNACLCSRGTGIVLFAFRNPYWFPKRLLPWSFCIQEDDAGTRTFPASVGRCDDW